MNNVGGTVGNTKIMEHFIETEVGSYLDSIGDRIIPFDIASGTRSKSKEYAFARVSMKFAFLASIVGTWRTNPNAAAKSSKLGKIFFLVEGKRDGGCRITTRLKCVLHSKMVMEGIGPEFGSTLLPTKK